VNNYNNFVCGHYFLKSCVAKQQCKKTKARLYAMLMRSIDSIACQELPVTVKKEPSVNLEEKHAESYEGHLEWQANLTDAQWEEFSSAKGLNRYVDSELGAYFTMSLSDTSHLKIYEKESFLKVLSTSGVILDILR
jgi:hypothetical protein